MRYSTPKIVQPGSGLLPAWLIALLVLALIGSILAYLHFSQRVAGPAIEELQHKVSIQQRRIEELESERVALNERITGLTRASQIDQEAIRQVREELSSRQEERASMEEELAFLRSMVSSKEDREGIQVQRFKLHKGAPTGVYHYSFTLTQTIKNGDAAVGWIFFAVDGVSAGKPAWLPLREITEESTEKVKMRFKHFQDVEGEIRLPEGFKPLKVIIEVKPNNKKLPELKQRFDWVVEEI